MGNKDLPNASARGPNWEAWWTVVAPFLVLLLIASGTFQGWWPRTLSENQVRAIAREEAERVLRELGPGLARMVACDVQSEAGGS